jgi:hypothetical protein
LDGLADAHQVRSPKSSLFHALTHESIEPTNNKPHSPIYTLNDDVLLNIFYLYRLHVTDEEDDEGVFFERMWDRQRWWYKPAQVSRRWRYLILASPALLNLHLLCTYGVPVADMLAHSPPLPLIIFYIDGYHEMTAEDEEGALLALSHHDRVHYLALRMPAPKLGQFIRAMDDQFPILERICIESTTEEDTGLILPTTLQASNLRQITLLYAALPIRSPILAPITGLTCLWLWGIPRTTYLPPNHILTILPLMPQLNKMAIGFDSPLPNGDVIRQLSLRVAPNMTHVNLPNLRVFAFQGVSAYLEGLLSRINAPVLNIFHVHLFNQLTFTVPHLLQFTQTSENLSFSAVELAFYGNFVDLMADPHRIEGEPHVRIRLMCTHLDWQVAFALQILDTLSPLLPLVEELTLSYMEHDLSSEWHNEVDPTQWSNLLRSFSNVNALHVANNPPEGLSRALHLEDGELPLELLPNLLNLQYFGGNSVKRRVKRGPVSLASRFLRAAVRA